MSDPSKHEHYPGGPWGPDEWSSGLRLVEEIERRSEPGGRA